MVLGAGRLLFSWSAGSAGSVLAGAGASAGAVLFASGSADGGAAVAGSAAGCSAVVVAALPVLPPSSLGE